MTHTLNLVAQIAALVGAVGSIAVSPLEMFLYGKPAARKFLNVHTNNIDDVRMWAFVVGARNLIAGTGMLFGLVTFWTGNQSTGTIIVLTVAWYMLLASLAMGVADILGFWKPRGGSIRGTIGSSIPPLVVIIVSYL
ncbi:DUF1304 family protein [Corynebacterium comes]|uniref:DUF1304 domain-containing protein n=1 Tax=Corynebacterium comes TaxID=2675218 RepID=A0A6B8VYR5_9CORY|nr:DUF1304 family protein [Corynebacterium comes]QGU04195.1 hypothetical protein CETAM_04620 [Corynebacterium comes]